MTDFAQARSELLSHLLKTRSVSVPVGEYSPGDPGRFVTVRESPHDFIHSYGQVVGVLMEDDARTGAPASDARTQHAMHALEEGVALIKGSGFAVADEQHRRILYNAIDGAQAMIDWMQQNIDRLHTSNKVGAYKPEILPEHLEFVAQLHDSCQINRRVMEEIRNDLLAFSAAIGGAATMPEVAVELAPRKVWTPDNAQRAQAKSTVPFVA